MSQVDYTFLKKEDYSNMLNELRSGHLADASMLKNSRKDRSNLKQSATYKQKELFPDMLLHIMVRARYYGHCPLEWC